MPFPGSRVVLVWLLLVVVAVLNGAVREALISPRLGTYAGHIASTLTLCLAIVAVAWLTLNWMGLTTRGEAWRAGVLWLALTVAFEFLAGHYLFGTPWERLFADYDIFAGRIWVLVLVVTLAAPRVAMLMRAPGVTGFA